MFWSMDFCSCSPLSLSSVGGDLWTRPIEYYFSSWFLLRFGNLFILKFSCNCSSRTEAIMDHRRPLLQSSWFQRFGWRKPVRVGRFSYGFAFQLLLSRGSRGTRLFRIRLNRVTRLPCMFFRSPFCLLSIRLSCPAYVLSLLRLFCSCNALSITSMPIRSIFWISDVGR